jgi:hypothetical protein
LAALTRRLRRGLVALRNGFGGVLIVGGGELLLDLLFEVAVL